MSEHSVNIIIRSVTTNDKIYRITIDNDYTFLDLLFYLSNINGRPYIYSSFRIRQTYELIGITNLSDKLFAREYNGEITLLEIGYFTPKNSLEQLQNILNLHRNNLLETNNISDVCCINLGKIGEWIGYGQGPTSVPKEEDNRIHNLMFVRFNNDNPVAYNAHCLNKMVSWDGTASVLIPHLNKRVKVAKFFEIYESRDNLKILNLNGNDIVY